MNTPFPWGKRPACQCALPPWGKRPACQCAPPPWSKHPACHAPRAFTLIELLVVIGIIALLAALLTPVVMQSLTKARNAAIKAEIDMLHMALMNYQSEYGVLPPCYDSIRWTAGTYGAGGEAARHLRRVFPRCSDPAAQITASSGNTPLTPLNAIVAWLNGFTTNPASPLVPPASRVKLYDFDRARITGSGAYFPSGKSESPYLYIDNTRYGIPIPVTTSLSMAALRIPLASDPRNFANPSQPPFNQATFQILCAGRDGQWDTDDDLSNFWPGTRREYIDSLKD